jgi:hypothetical protein
MNMFERLDWCPIDIDRFPYPDMSMDVSNDFWAWTFKRLTNDNLLSRTAVHLNKEILHEYPLLAEWMRLFPFRSIRNVKFNIQKEEVEPHIDFGNPRKDPELYENNRINEPCGYRVVISGARKNSFYVVHGDQKIYADMPDDTDVYVLGQTCTNHGVSYEPGRRTMFLHFEIDPIPHQLLLERSLEKYGDRAIWTSMPS